VTDQRKAYPIFLEMPFGVIIASCFGLRKLLPRRTAAEHGYPAADLLGGSTLGRARKEQHHLECSRTLSLSLSRTWVLWGYLFALRQQD